MLTLKRGRRRCEECNGSGVCSCDGNPCYVCHVRPRRFDSILAGVTVAIVSAGIGATLALVVYVAHYSHASSPVGQHCWNEVNASQPYGVEKICMAGGGR